MPKNKNSLIPVQSEALLFQRLLLLISFSSQRIVEIARFLLILHRRGIKLQLLAYEFLRVVLIFTVYPIMRARKNFEFLFCQFL